MDSLASGARTFQTTPAGHGCPPKVCQLGACSLRQFQCLRQTSPGPCDCQVWCSTVCFARRELRGSTCIENSRRGQQPGVAHIDLSAGALTNDHPLLTFAGGIADRKKKKREEESFDRKTCANKRSISSLFLSAPLHTRYHTIILTLHQGSSLVHPHHILPIACYKIQLLRLLLPVFFFFFWVFLRISKSFVLFTP